MRIGVASDHAGFRYKTLVAEHLRRLGHEVRDFGTGSEEPVDYPDFVFPLAEAVAGGELERGFVFGGSGNGEAMTANRVRGVRCAVAWDLEPARLSARTTTRTCCRLGSVWWPSRSSCPWSTSGWRRHSRAGVTSSGSRSSTGRRLSRS